VKVRIFRLLCADGQCSPFELSGDVTTLLFDLLTQQNYVTARLSN